MRNTSQRGRRVEMMKRLLLMPSLITLCTIQTAVAETVRPEGLDRIDHVIVIYLENRSFDNLFGNFPGADGLQNADKTAVQVDKDGLPYKTLPRVMDASKTPPQPDLRFPQELPNRPFPIDRYIGQEDPDPNLTHLWYQQQAQIDRARWINLHSSPMPAAL